MSTNDTPSGESPLEERLREYVSAFDGARDAYTGEPEVFHRDMIAEAAAELARLTAEAARLTAEVAQAHRTLDAEGIELMRENDPLTLGDRIASNHAIFRAEAARYREALEEADRDLAEVEDLALGKTVERIAAVRAKVYATLTTEGGDRAD